MSVPHNARMALAAFELDRMGLTVRKIEGGATVLAFAMPDGREVEVNGQDGMPPTAATADDLEVRLFETAGGMRLRTRFWALGPEAAVAKVRELLGAAAKDAGAGPADSALALLRLDQLGLARWSCGMNGEECIGIHLMPGLDVLVADPARPGNRPDETAKALVVSLCDRRDGATLYSLTLPPAGAEALVRGLIGPGARETA